MKTRHNTEQKTHPQVTKILDNFQKTLESEKKHLDTLDNILEGFQIIGFDWRYLYVNNAVVTQSKFAKEELLGKTMQERYPGIEGTEMFKALRLCMHARIAKHFENEFTFPDGSAGWFELSIQPVEEGLVILSNDITERKRAELQKKEYTDALEKMIFMTSHNLRQPITHILGLVNLLENCKNTKEELDKIVHHFKNSAMELDVHTKELTNFIHEQETKAKSK